MERVLKSAYRREIRQLAVKKVSFLHLPFTYNKHIGSSLLCSSLSVVAAPYRKNYQLHSQTYEIKNGGANVM